MGYDCAMIGHTQLFLWSRYSDIISLLTITVRGYQISIAYCLFFIYSLANQETCILLKPNQIIKWSGLKITYNLCIVKEAKLEIRGSHR